MITRRKAIIIVTGKERTEVIGILRKHEALVQIYDESEVKKVWGKNKTPIINSDDFIKIFSQYEGTVLVFNTDEQNIWETNQEEITRKITKFCYQNLIEPGEFKVANTANNSAEGCFFCEITRHPGKTTYTHNLDCKIVDMIVYESENFVVVPGLGPLAPGYLMIMTKDHYLSLAQIPENLYDEYHQIEKDIEMILHEMYGKKVGFYEHGTGPNGAVGLKSIVHMHIHVMLDAELKEEYKNMLNMEKVSDIKDLDKVSYFWYKWESTGEEWAASDPETYIQRQFHRQVYAEEHNLAKDQFNWRKTAFEDTTKTNVWQLYEFLKNVEDSRIKARTNSFVEAAKIRFDS